MCATLPFLLLSLSGPWLGSARDELPALQAELEAALVTANQAELERLSRALDEYLVATPESAPAHALRGLAAIQRAVCTNGSADRRPDARLADRIEAATRHLQRARTLDPDLGDVHAALAFTAWLQFFLPDPDMPRLIAETGQALGDGMRVAPDHAYLQFLQVAALLSGPPPNAATLRKVEDDLFALAERIQERHLNSVLEVPPYWDLMSYGMAARSLLFLATPRPGLAAKLTEDLLDLAPDFAMARDFLQPFVRVRTPMERSEWSEREWVSLSSDEIGDTGVAALPDATGLLHSPDPEALWIRIPVADAPPETPFGINVVIAAGEDARDSTPWWGGNSIDFGLLVTVWVAKDSEGVYRGAVGLADHGPAYEGEMCQRADGTDGFARDEEDPAFVLRVPWADLGTDVAFELIAAVGSNAQWNDDVPNEGTVEVIR